MQHCPKCRVALTPGVRFCGACGAPVVTSDTDATRTASPPHDDEATRLARDSEVTRVAARSPFDDQQIAPARVERLGGANEPFAPTSPRPSQTHQGSRPNDDPRAAQALSRKQDSQVAATRGAAAVEETERVIFAVRPTLFFVGLGYVLAALAAVGLTILLAKFNLLSAFHSVLVSLPLLLIPAFYHLRRNTIKYTLTDAKIEIDRGLIARRTRNIPLRNIQDVTVAATIPQRLLRFGDLIIDNASELGGSTVMHNIPAPRRHAELLLREMRRRN